MFISYALTLDVHLELLEKWARRSRILIFLPRVSTNRVPRPQVQGPGQPEAGVRYNGTLWLCTRLEWHKSTFRHIRGDLKDKPAGSRLNSSVQPWRIIKCFARPVGASWSTMNFACFRAASCQPFGALYKSMQQSTSARAASNHDDWFGPAAKRSLRTP